MKKKIDFLKRRNLETFSFRSSKESNIMSSKRENNLSPSVARLFESYDEKNTPHDDEERKGGRPERFAWSAFQNSPNPDTLPLPSPNLLSELISCS